MRRLVFMRESERTCQREGASLRDRRQFHYLSPVVPKKTIKQRNCGSCMGTALRTPKLRKLDNGGLNMDREHVKGMADKAKGTMKEGASAQR